MMADQILKQETITQRDVNSPSQRYENRRRHVRVFYPTGCPAKFLPDLILNHRVCLVLDISEGGIRIAVSNANQVKDGTVMALLRFPDGTDIEISGVVIRRNYNQIALMLDKGIPYSRILSDNSGYATLKPRA
ncbi:MAG: hypothetical protein C0410_11145 [Anaerolinea sp.]|nr:hypothetical protein [Anaerolinea sp.]